MGLLALRFFLEAIGVMLVLPDSLGVVISFKISATGSWTYLEETSIEPIETFGSMNDFSGVSSSPGIVILGDCLVGGSTCWYLGVISTAMSPAFNTLGDS